MVGGKAAEAAEAEEVVTASGGEGESVEWLLLLLLLLSTLTWPLIVASDAAVPLLLPTFESIVSSCIAVSPSARE